MRDITEPLQCPNLPAHFNVRVLHSYLPSTGSYQAVSDTASFCYVGRTSYPTTPAYAAVLMTNAGSGAQTAEIGLFSSTSAPCKTNLTLMKIWAVAITEDMTTGAPKMVRNPTAQTTLIGTGTHLWAGIRTAMAVAQPRFNGLQREYGYGYVLTTATAGALTASSTFTGALVTAGTSVQAADVRVELD